MSLAILNSVYLAKQSRSIKLKNIVKEIIVERCK